MIPPGPLVLERQLADLATLEPSIRTALRALHVSYPAIAHPPHDDEA